MRHIMKPSAITNEVQVALMMWLLLVHLIFPTSTPGLACIQDLILSSFISTLVSESNQTITALLFCATVSVVSSCKNHQPHHQYIKTNCCIKDTKKSMTWWCLMAPIRPIIAINNRNTPHAMTPPKTDTVAMIATAFPYAATPINVIATAYNWISRQSTTTLRHWYASTTLR